MCRFAHRNARIARFYSEASSGELINRYVAALVRELEIVADDLRTTNHFLWWRHAIHSEPAAMGNHPARDGKIEPARRRGILPSNAIRRPSRLTRQNNSATSASTAFRWAFSRLTKTCSTGLAASTRANRYSSRSTFLRQAGFDNLNLDLMFAIPTQTRLCGATR